MYQIYFTKRAQKDKKLLKQAGLDKKAKELLNIISENPFQNPPFYEKPEGDLKGKYSRRINYQHRLVYKIDNDAVIVHSMWSHYGE